MIFVHWRTHRVPDWRGRSVKGGWHVQRDGERRTVCGIPENFHPHYRVVCPAALFQRRRLCRDCARQLWQRSARGDVDPHPGG